MFALINCPQLGLIASHSLSAPVGLLFKSDTGETAFSVCSLSLALGWLIVTHIGYDPSSEKQPPSWSFPFWRYTALNPFDSFVLHSSTSFIWECTLSSLESPFFYIFIMMEALIMLHVDENKSIQSFHIVAPVAAHTTPYTEHLQFVTTHVCLFHPCENYWMLWMGPKEQWFLETYHANLS